MAYLRRVAGYFLIGGNPEEVAFDLFGPGASGKSTFAEAVKAMLGEYAMTASFDTLLARPPKGGAPSPDLARLRGARLVVAAEVDEGKKLASGLLKSLTGGDTIVARPLYKQEFEFIPEFKLVLVANHPPIVDGADDAIWRRLRVIPFERSVPESERDTNVKRSLCFDDSSRAAILAWAVAGCLEYQAAGLGTPPVVRDATEGYRESMDPLADFFAEVCELAPNLWVPSAEIWRRHTAWASANGVEALANQRQMAHRLRKLGCEPRSGSGNIRGWSGIGFKRLSAGLVDAHLLPPPRALPPPSNALAKGLEVAEVAEVAVGLPEEHQIEIPDVSCRGGSGTYTAPLAQPSATRNPRLGDEGIDDADDLVDQLEDALRRDIEPDELGSGPEGNTVDQPEKGEAVGLVAPGEDGHEA